MQELISPGANMKRLFALLCPLLFLAGCVAVPYDAETVYYPAPTVSAHISSGNYYPYSRPYPYYQPPVYVAPAPVIVPPPRHFNYNRNVRPGMQNYPHPRNDGVRDRPRQDLQRRDGGRPEWQERGGGRSDGQHNRQRDGHRNWQRDGQRDGPQDGQRDGRRGDFRNR